MAAVERKKVRLSGSKRTLEQWKKKLEKRKWNFITIVTEGWKAQTVFALFERSIVRELKRQVRRAQKWVRIDCCRTYESMIENLAEPEFAEG